VNPIWSVPSIVCIFVVIGKSAEAIRLPNSKKHFGVMGVYIGAAYLLYILVYLLVFNASESLFNGGMVSSHALEFHSVVIALFLSIFLLLVYMARRAVERVRTPTIEEITKHLNKNLRLAERVAERLSDTNERVTEYREECQEKYEEVKRGVEERYEKENERIDSLDGVVDDHEATMER